jgi:hypothetical protein
MDYVLTPIWQAGTHHLGWLLNQMTGILFHLAS